MQGVTALTQTVKPPSELTTLQRELKSVCETMTHWTSCMENEVATIRRRTLQRGTAEQWLDENEREWMSMDEMLASRPWAPYREKPCVYPFREVTNAMRAAEGPWPGDNLRFAMEDTRHEAACDVLVHVRPAREHPPSTRLVLFTPEFGSDSSFNVADWSAFGPEVDTDIWVVSWQGYGSMREVQEQVLRKVLSFADGVSTVWYGHSFGAIVAYELLKKMEEHYTPNLPVGLVVSGCPAPHLVAEQYRPFEQHPWLAATDYLSDLDGLTQEQIDVLRNQFQVNIPNLVVPPGTEKLVQAGILPPEVQAKYNAPPELTKEQKIGIMGDCRLIKKYAQPRQGNAARIVVPLLAFCHDEDPLVASTSVEAWRDVAPAADQFEFVPLEDFEDSETLAWQGHGYASSPVPTIINKIVELSDKHRIIKDIDEVKKIDIGPTDGPLPDKADVLVVGAGIAGVTGAAILGPRAGRSVLVVDRFHEIGGIWNFYANKFSRVNTSELGYRIVDQALRPNEDHSPTHDIMRDVFEVAKESYGCFRLQQEVKKIEKNPDETYTATIKDVRTGKLSKVVAKAVSIHVNRRLGRRRSVVYPNEISFRGDLVYGYANEVLPLKFWGRRVIVIGAGAFAFENLRTALEHGAKHATILGRRSGTTCPKWIDVIAFIRPCDQYYVQNKAGNMISFEAWRKCYTDCNLKTPECWEEGLLKPHNHTVSVSDLAFVGGYYGMVDLKVGEIKNFRPDGHGVLLKDGSKMEADVVIKCTGFHLNSDVPGICGLSKMYPWGSLDHNMGYGAEPQLDGGQFGGSKGKVQLEVEEVNQDEIMAGMRKMTELGFPTAWLIPRAHPYGSGYVHGMMQMHHFFDYLLAHPEEQKMLLKTAGAPVNDTTQLWASHLAQGLLAVMKRIVVALQKEGQPPHMDNGAGEGAE